MEHLPSYLPLTLYQLAGLRGDTQNLASYFHRPSPPLGASAKGKRQGHSGREGREGREGWHSGRERGTILCILLAQNRISNVVGTFYVFVFLVWLCHFFPLERVLDWRGVCLLIVHEGMIGSAPTNILTEVLNKEGKGLCGRHFQTPSPASTKKEKNIFDNNISYHNTNHMAIIISLSLLISLSNTATVFATPTKPIYT